MFFTMAGSPYSNVRTMAVIQRQFPRGRKELRHSMLWAMEREQKIRTVVVAEGTCNVSYGEKHSYCYTLLIEPLGRWAGTEDCSAAPIGRATVGQYALLFQEVKAGTCLPSPAFQRLSPSALTFQTSGLLGSTLKVVLKGSLQAGYGSRLSLLAENYKNTKGVSLRYTLHGTYGATPYDYPSPALHRPLTSNTADHHPSFIVTTISFQ
jgi:hypothetical protein